MLVVASADLLDRHEAVLDRVFTFLGLPSHPVPAESLYVGDYSITWEVRLARMYAAFLLRAERDIGRWLD